MKPDAVSPLGRTDRPHACRFGGRHNVRHPRTGPTLRRFTCRSLGAASLSLRSRAQPCCRSGRRRRASACRPSRWTKLRGPRGAPSRLPRIERRAGLLYQMNPQYVPHGAAKADVAEALVAALARLDPPLRVLSEVSVRVSETEVAMPDISVVQRGRYPAAVPVEQVRPVVEVSDITTLADDLGRKRALYALGGILSGARSSSTGCRRATPTRSRRSCRSATSWPRRHCLAWLSRRPRFATTIPVDAAGRDRGLSQAPIPIARPMSCNTCTPGSVFPSSHSRNAPPAVLT